MSNLNDRTIIMKKNKNTYNNFFFLQKSFFLAFMAVIVLASCQKEPPVDNTALDNELEMLLADLGGKDFFAMPSSDDFASIPQDPNNPITKEKVTLGQLLFHETGLATNPLQEMGNGTYSCASCHFAAAGFQAGRFQAIAEGGIGFGVNGEGRMRNNLYGGDDLMYNLFALLVL